MKFTKKDLQNIKESLEAKICHCPEAEADFAGNKFWGGSCNLSKDTICYKAFKRMRVRFDKSGYFICPCYIYNKKYLRQRFRRILNEKA